MYEKQCKKLTYGALLTALAIIIPVSFGVLRVQIGPFTATLGAHVPIFFSMLFGPYIASIVALGSALGFLITSPLVIAARALMHVLVGGIGAILIKKDINLKNVILITAPLHGILEAISVIPFGFTVYKILIVVGVGSMIHHIVDGIVFNVIIKGMEKTGITNFSVNKII
ncbi:ECF transporter S component [Clostridium botulinum]|nr:ECF transporter S component [Clostridium botulinum]QPW59000.1 ECF transporter S component [Clostridium botulinum]